MVLRRRMRGCSGAGRLPLHSTAKPASVASNSDAGGSLAPVAIRWMAFNASRHRLSRSWLRS